MNAVTETVAAEPVSGVEIFVPLAKLKKSPRNARKVPHGEAAIEALAASIQHKGLIQNLVVEPETKEDGTPTGYYLVTAGEGRRLAMLLRAKRKQIKKSEAVRCWLDTANDPSKISLDENVTRTPMHPADQFERFRELADGKGSRGRIQRRALLEKIHCGYYHRCSIDEGLVTNLTRAVSTSVPVYGRARRACCR